MAALNPDQVEHVAFLARLELSAEERDLLAAQLGAVLLYADQLQEVDLEGVEATFSILPRTNVFREDEVREPLGPEAVLSNAPAREGDYFRIPRILEED